jgi:outer membrane murein-binding lipoprotein Lpp
MTPETIVSELKELRSKVEKLEANSPASVSDLSTKVDQLEANLNSLRDVVGVPEHGSLTDAETAVNNATAAAEGSNSTGG